jgi:hypothetical protein
MARFNDPLSNDVPEENRPRPLCPAAQLANAYLDSPPRTGDGELERRLRVRLVAACVLQRCFADCRGAARAASDWRRARHRRRRALPKSLVGRGGRRMLMHCLECGRELVGGLCKGGSYPHGFVPTPEQIRAAEAEIRLTWTAADWRRRWEGESRRRGARRVILIPEDAGQAPRT